jgi:hypothetical protein
MMRIEIRSFHGNLASQLSAANNPFVFGKVTLNAAFRAQAGWVIFNLLAEGFSGSEGSSVAPLDPIPLVPPLNIEGREEVKHLYTCISL